MGESSTHSADEPAAANSTISTTGEEHTWVDFQLDVAADQETVPIAGTRPLIHTERHNTREDGDSCGDLGDIFKIQKAQGALIMMVYDKTRKRQTFLHKDMPGFKEVLRLLLREPMNKGYFWGRDVDPETSPDSGEGTGE